MDGLHEPDGHWVLLRAEVTGDKTAYWHGTRVVPSLARLREDLGFFFEPHGRYLPAYTYGAWRVPESRTAFLWLPNRRGIDYAQYPHRGIPFRSVASKDGWRADILLGLDRLLPPESVGVSALEPETVEAVLAAAGHTAWTQEGGYDAADDLAMRYIDALIDGS